jgi:hypothetical protein
VGLRLGAAVFAATLVAVTAPRLGAVTNPIQPADGSVVTTQNPTFVVAVTFTGDPFATIVVSSNGGAVGSCSPQKPVGPTGEQSGTFGCQLANALPPGPYSWVAQYARPVCSVVNCPNPQTVQGPFSFTVNADATARPVPSTLTAVTATQRSVTAQLWVGGSPQNVASVSCRAGSLHVATSHKGNVGACAWKLPRSLAGKTLRGKLTLAGPAGSHASATFAVRVRR